MRIDMRNLAGRVHRVALGLWLLVTAFLVNGCSMATESAKPSIGRFDFQSSFSEKGTMRQGVPVPNTPSIPTDNDTEKLGLSESESKALGCNIQDRFDRGATLAYTFDDRKSRVALNLSLDGPSLSNPSRLQVNSVMIRFTHRFQKPLLGKKEKCLMPSNFQGMIGSGYNEFFLRNNFTIWKDLRNRLNMAQ